MKAIQESINTKPQSHKQLRQAAVWFQEGRGKFRQCPDDVNSLDMHLCGIRTGRVLRVGAENALLISEPRKEG